MRCKRFCVHDLALTRLLAADPCQKETNLSTTRVSLVPTVEECSASTIKSKSFPALSSRPSSLEAWNLVGEKLVGNLWSSFA